MPADMIWTLCGLAVYAIIGVVVLIVMLRDPLYIKSRKATKAEREQIERELRKL